MKKVTILYLAFLAVVATACSDYLDTENLTKKTDGNYYSTETECKEALVGCYDALQLIYDNGTALPNAANVCDDMTFGSTGYSDGEGYPMLDQFDQGVSPTDDMFGDNWAEYYKGIFRCNKLIEKIDNTDWTGKETTKAEILAEAHFLRAYFYFDMVRIWERVPLLETQSSENVPQAEADDTYTLIAKDLLFAAENGNKNPYASISQTTYGHANAWAAKAMLARVYLYYTGYYGKSDLVGLVTATDALNGLENIISEGGFDLVEDYNSLWPAAATGKAVKNGGTLADASYAGETNKEIIFSIKYTYMSDYNGNTEGNHWLVMNGIRGAASGKYGYGQGWGACTVVPSAYTEWDAKDTRRDASIIAIAEEGITYPTTARNDVKEYTGYFTKKYIPQCDASGKDLSQVLYGAANNMIYQFQDFFVMRYADVLLMAAELGSTNAETYFKKVRNRAYAGTAPDLALNKDNIFEERRREFAFEGIWYFDMLRYESSLQYAADRVSINTTVLRGGNESAKVIDGNNLKRVRGLFPIPFDEIDLSGGLLEQNEGWGSKY
ncbi:MAG: RagB/SusD family nutrient uptake outer membrane protein [Marinilabiliaceae bacterium]|nr:RagB/SusD family nutrient uptake outer membrane protein [Marinilabiliaceae bacterium]